jgi:hypothetical protein
MMMSALVSVLAAITRSAPVGIGRSAEGEHLTGWGPGGGSGVSAEQCDTRVVDLALSTCFCSVAVCFVA